MTNTQEVALEHNTRRLGVAKMTQQSVGVNDLDVLLVLALAAAHKKTKRQLRGFCANMAKATEDLELRAALLLIARAKEPAEVIMCAVDIWQENRP